MHTVNYCRLLLLRYIRPACKAEIPPCTSTTRLSRGVLHQRGRSRHAAHGLALSRYGSAYQAPPLFLCWESVASVSGESGIPLSPGSTMSRLAGASPPAASWSGLDAIASSTAMCRRQSLRLVATAHHRFPCSMLCRLGQWARRSTAMPRHHEAVAWCAWQLWCTPAAATRFALT